MALDRPSDLPDATTCDDRARALELCLPTLRDGAQAVDVEVATGVYDGTFRPGDPVTRGPFASMLATGLALQAVEDVKLAGRFFDQPGVHGPAIVTLASPEFATRFPDGAFRPGDPIRRAQTDPVLVREMPRSR